jgi:hypothetical protein
VKPKITIISAVYNKVDCIEDTINIIHQRKKRADIQKDLQMVNDGYILFLGAGDSIVSLIDSQLL